ncbi:MAG: MarR family transcriptional regulator [Salinivirgaceae bacterium]|jgi:predicted ArsR family transcriptional regulator
MEPKEQVLKAMQQKAAPMGAGEIAEITGLDKKVVDKAMKQLKTEEAIFSPVRCKWQAK